MRILIAEDDATSRLLMERRLQSWGYEVVVARDGQEAWEKAIGGSDIQLVVSDWMMPGMDGPQFCKKIREAALTRYVYIILLTAKAHKEDLVQGMEMGADDYLTKPFDAGELRARIRAGERILQLEGILAAHNHALAQANQVMRRDLQAAAKIQASLLPLAAPSTRNARFAWAFRPCEYIAGDIFNIFQIDEHRLGIYLLDVSGHGVPAAMQAVALSRLLAPASDLTPEGMKISVLNGVSPLAPQVVAAALNERFQMDDETGQYFTMIYGVLDTQALRFDYVNAGHPQPLLVTAAGHAALEPAIDPPIGMIPALEFHQQTMQLSRHDRLFLYTDGLVEAQNSRKEFLGSRLLDLAAAARDQSLEHQVSGVMTQLDDWVAPSPVQDDVTLIGVEMVGKGER